MSFNLLSNSKSRLKQFLYLYLVQMMVCEKIGNYLIDLDLISLFNFTFKDSCKKNFFWLIKMEMKGTEKKLMIDDKNWKSTGKVIRL